MFIGKILITSSLILLLEHQMSTSLLWKTSSTLNSYYIYFFSIKNHFSSRDVQCDGAVLVTTPQAVAVGDVRRELTFCKKTGLKVLGILENMCGFVCPHCSECTNIFSRGGGESLAQLGQVPFLGRIPIDPQLTRSVEDGTNFIETFNQSATAQAFIGIVKNLITPPVESMEVVEK